MTKKTTQYKETKMGKIPRDWEVRKLGDVFKLTSGKTKPALIGNEKNTFNVYPVYGGNGVIGYSSEFNLKYEAIIIGRVGENCGVTRYINEKCWVTDNALFTKDFFINIDIKFLSFGIHFIDLSKLRSKGGQPLISQNPIHSLLFPLPPLLEQQKIAEVLSTWDEAIQQTEKLISALEKRNKGLAFVLLTGKKRLRGFDGKKIQNIRIKDIATEISARNKDDKDYVVFSCTKYKGLVPSLEYFGKKIYSDDLTTYKVIKRTQFAYATNHIEEGSMGVLESAEMGLISPMYTIFEFNSGVNLQYIFKVLKSEFYISEYKKRMEGSIDRRGGLRWDEFSKIRVNLPSLEEQNAIAQVLNMADSELKQQQQKLLQFQLEKKGLMQQLLTGKVRTI